MSRSQCGHRPILRRKTCAQQPRPVQVKSQAGRSGFSQGHAQWSGLRCKSAPELSAEQ